MREWGVEGLAFTMIRSSFHGGEIALGIGGDGKDSGCAVYHRNNHVVSTRILRLTSRSDSE